MSEYLPVTQPQALAIQKIANEKRVGRKAFQKGLDNGRIAKFLESLKTDPTSDDPNIQTRTFRMRYKQDCRWSSAIKAITSWKLTGYDVWKVGRAFPPSGSGEAEHEYVLLNYSNEDGDLWKALDWAKQNGHECTNPREAFAVLENFPGLVGELPRFRKELRIVATTVAENTTFENKMSGACYAFLEGTTRGAYVNLPGNCRDDGATCCWYLFRKKKSF